MPIQDLLTGDDLLSALEWADNLGYQPHQVFGIKGLIPSSHTKTLNHWLNSKISIEGHPDESVVNSIGEEGIIHKPIVLDSDREYCLEGRHRLSAAIKYNLDCPVVDLILIKDPESYAF